MLVLLDHGPLHIDPGRRRMLVTQCILCLKNASCRLTDPPGKGVARLMQVDIPDAGPPRVYLEPFGKSVPSQFCTTMQPGRVVPGPQRRLQLDFHVFSCYT